MHRKALATTTTLGLLALTTPGAAQQAQPQKPPTTGSVEVAPPAGGSGPGTDTGAAGDKKDAAPSSGGALGGYAYSDKPTARTGAPHARYRASGPVVNMPGFEQTDDGGSRLFVALSQNVPVEERKAQGSVTYVLKGASPRVWNNTNALVTVHFNTPVARARLVPQGKDLLFIVELRAAASPTWKITDGADKTATLAIDFPKGDYLTPGVDPAAAAAAPPAGAAPATKPPSPPARGVRRGRAGTRSQPPR